ncbi:MAG: PLP-dependent aminotransferase family protein [Leptolyngbyaceae cyanobacterium]
MKIAVDRQATEPVYLQIRDRISYLIQAGGLKVGDRLPSIRSMAQTTNVNKLTVIEAYSVLEADGLIYARQGAGYFISQATVTPPARPASFAPEQTVIIPEQGLTSFSEVSDAFLQAQAQPGMINLNSGYPQAVGVEDLQRISRRAIKNVAGQLFHHNPPEGDPILREQIAQLLSKLGLGAAPQDLIITNGSMQALCLVTQHLIQPGDWVVVESPSFHAYLSLLQQIDARIIGMPMTATGMNLDLLEQFLKSHRPKLIYTNSTLHNPTGITTSLAHRRRLVELAEQYDCWVIEDNAYEWLSFDTTPPPIKALDRRDRVIYTGTFSKSLMPALRLGYAVITGDLYREIVERKLLHDLHVSIVSQGIVREYLATGHYRRRINHLKALNQQNRGVMVRALEEHFPAEASWTIPAGGVFLWVQLPKQINVAKLHRAAVKENVFVGSGQPFFPDQQGYPALRLGFAQPMEDIERGIAVVGRLLKAHMARHR